MDETRKIPAQEHIRQREPGRTGNPILTSDGRRIIEGLAGYLKKACKNQLLRAKFQENWIQTQLTVVSNHAH